MDLKPIIAQINREKPGKTLLQLPDGLKPKSKEIYEEIKKNTSTELFLWFNSCYGACDIPNVDVDLLIQFGHAEFK